MLPFTITGEGAFAVFLVSVIFGTLLTVLSFAWLDDNDREECYANGYVWTTEVRDSGRTFSSCKAP